MNSNTNIIQAWLQRLEPAVLLIVMLAVLFMRCKFVGLYPVHDDELISFGVMQSIANEGLPLISAGVVYWGSFTAYYLMAIPLFWLEPGLLAFRLVTILCSVLVLPVCYWLCREAHGRLAAWLAVAFLAFSSYQNLFAAFSRFYMPFQLFFLATIFFAGSYFMQKRSGAGWGLWLCLFLAVGSHRFAVYLLPALLLAWWLGGRPALWRRPGFWAGLLLLAGWCWLNWIWRPESVHTGSLALPLLLGGLHDKLTFVDIFSRFAPGGVSLLILGLYPLLRERRPWWVYLYGTFAIGMLLLALTAPADNPRYMIQFFPLGVILACVSLVWWLEQAAGWLRTPRMPVFSCWGGVAGLVVVAALGYAVTLENRNVTESVGTAIRFPNQKPVHDYISMLIKPGDKIMSTDPALTSYYLQRPVDYWLREQYDAAGNRHLPFRDEDKREQGNPETYYYLDHPDKLTLVLKEAEHGIWLYANEKFHWGLSAEMKAIVKQNFAVRYYVGETHALHRPAPRTSDARPLP